MAARSFCGPQMSQSCDGVHGGWAGSCASHGALCRLRRACREQPPCSARLLYHTTYEDALKVPDLGSRLGPDSHLCRASLHGEDHALSRVACSSDHESAVLLCCGCREPGSCSRGEAENPTNSQ